MFNSISKVNVPSVFFHLLILMVGALLRLPVANAHIPEEGMIWTTMGPLVNRTIETPQDANEKNRDLWGFGLIVEGDFNPKGGLEIGALYLKRQYHLKHQGAILVERVNRVHIPLGYRRWFTDKFSGGLAFYSSYRMGGVTEVQRPPTIPKTIETTASDEIAEYGIDFSVQWQPWIKDRYALLIDARYSLPINENAHESADQIMVLVGVKYLVQKKN